MDSRHIFLLEQYAHRGSRMYPGYYFSCACEVLARDGGRLSNQEFTAAISLFGYSVKQLPYDEAQKIFDRYLKQKS